MRPRLAWPDKVARIRPVATYQIRTVPSLPPEASQLPSGATATAAHSDDATPTGWLDKVARIRPVAMSQILTVPSPPPEASQLPSGATATAITGLVRPRLVDWTRWPGSGRWPRPRSLPSRPSSRRPASCHPAPPPPPSRLVLAS